MYDIFIYIVVVNWQLVVHYGQMVCNYYLNFVQNIKYVVSFRLVKIKYHI
jgi:hypothetical protein